MNEPVIYRRDGHVARITINRPQVMNALDTTCHIALRKAFEEFRDDDDLWIAVLTGAGDRAFCAGQDLREVSRKLSGESVASSELVWGGITRDFDCDKPILAAVNGVALGGGTEVALAADLVIAADHARFGLPEPRRGIIAGAGGAFRLSQQVPLKQAMGLLLTGRVIDAAEAYSLGLVTQVVPGDQLETTVDRWIDDVLACSPLSIRMTKRLALAAARSAESDTIVLQGEMIRAVRESRDAREGVQAFHEKRTPEWSNR
ncbi:enoyl-CoA hydratase-related protein [Nocardia rhamnosiphila]|uniref:Enoyl-CoA hydratase-related protein n=1 Tax=Nocardia rhamnosiphila TaxID=426716 RepID=A0ABV2WRI0_9NOCA